MKQKFILVLFLGLQLGQAIAQQKTPDQLYGQLFIDIQMQNALHDGKTFVDCVPRKDPQLILSDYLKLKKSKRTINLQNFVAANFILPDTTLKITTAKNTNVVAHINTLWTALLRQPSVKTTNSTLLALPYPYIVPGGRFREIYYWDSYFTMLGLKVSGQNDIIENMIRNFAFLIDKHGHIPNGNRNYYLSRSQPPFFSLMVDLLAQIKNEQVYLTYLPYLEKEYAYWMDRSGPTKHLVSLPDGSKLNRYYDQLNIPRQESYKEDVLIAEQSGTQNPEIYRDIRSAAESGWDFSNRWFADGKQLKTIQTTQILPVDLNCLLYHLELTLEKCYLLKRNQVKAQLYQRLAQQRKTAIQKYFWSPQQGWYADYSLKTKRQSPVISLAGMFPLFFDIASQPQALAAKNTLQRKFLKAGGLISTLQNTHQQWDAPNGWAPLQWVSIMGLQHYGQHLLAKDIAQRWVNLNTRVYTNTGKLMEKYNVVDIHLKAGGGEYASQDGFGWTNGVLLGLIDKYNLPR